MGAPEPHVLTTDQGDALWFLGSSSPSRRRLSDPGPFDPAALRDAAALHHIEIFGPPPTA